MILRNVAIRHGRKALAAPIRKSLLRSLTTETIQQERAPIDSSTNEPWVEKLQQMSQMPSPEEAPKLPQKVSAKKQVRNDASLATHIRQRTKDLGAVVLPHYEPHHLIVNPPSPEDVTLELLMASQSHLGHATSLWNPMNQRYIFGIRDGVHIISLETTAAHLRRAAKVVEGVTYHGGLVLFVGTREGHGPAVVKAAENAKGCHLFQKWIPGTITNGDQILAKCGLQALNEHDQPLDGFQEKIVKWRALKPDLVVVMNPKENYILLHECGLNNIPTIGVIDTDADPTWVTYPIPANDDSIRCIQVIAGVLGRAGQSGQEKRLEDAKTGKITWTPPEGLGKPFEEENARLEKANADKSAKRKEQAKNSPYVPSEDVDVEKTTETRGSRAQGRLDTTDEEDL